MLLPHWMTKEEKAQLLTLSESNSTVYRCMYDFHTGWEITLLDPTSYMEPDVDRTLVYATLRSRYEHDFNFPSHGTADVTLIRHGNNTETGVLLIKDLT